MLNPFFGGYLSEEPGGPTTPMLVGGGCDVKGSGRIITGHSYRHVWQALTYAGFESAVELP